MSKQLNAIIFIALFIGVIGTIIFYKLSEDQTDAELLKDAKLFGVSYPEELYRGNYWFDVTADFRIENDRVAFVFYSLDGERYEKLSKDCEVISKHKDYWYYNCEQVLLSKEADN